MAEFIEVIKHKERMCRHFESLCSICTLGSQNNNSSCTCNVFVCTYPKEAEEIIMEWAKEHPIMTNADKFKEVFGIGEIFKKCAGFKCKDADCNICEYKDFWEREYKEPEKED